MTDRVDLSGTPANAPDSLAPMIELAVDLNGVFGNWPNLMQGLIGSAIGSGLGVFGAYWVASTQMRHERNAQRAAAGGQAAGAILETVLPLRRELAALSQLQPEHDLDEKGISRWRRERWQETTSAYSVAVTLRSHLLPGAVRSTLAALAGQLEEVLEWQWDEYEGLVWCAPAPPGGRLESVDGLAKNAQQSLVEYARATLGDPGRNPARTR